MRADVRNFGGEIVRDSTLDREVPLLHVSRACAAIHRVDTLAKSGIRRERDGRNGGAMRERKGRVHTVPGLLLDVLNKGKLRCREGRRDAGLIDEDDAEAGAHNRLRRDQIGKANTRRYVVEVKLTCTARVAVDAKIIKLLRCEVEDCALIVLFRRGEVKGPTCSQV